MYIAASSICFLFGALYILLLRVFAQIAAPLNYNFNTHFFKYEDLSRLAWVEFVKFESFTRMSKKKCEFYSGEGGGINSQ